MEKNIQLDANIQRILDFASAGESFRPRVVYAIQYIQPLYKDKAEYDRLKLQITDNQMETGVFPEIEALETVGCDYYVFGYLHTFGGKHPLHPENNILLDTKIWTQVIRDHIDQEGKLFIVEEYGGWYA